MKKPTSKGLSLGARDYNQALPLLTGAQPRCQPARYKRYRDRNDMVHERTRQLALTQEATIPRHGKPC